MRVLLNYLEKAEGLNVHYNATELDFTTPYGIYAFVHPNSDLVKYIRDLALKLNINKDSRDWSKADISLINQAIEDRNLYRPIRDLARMFYNSYLLKAHLQEFPEDCQIAMFSMFTNSQTLAWKAVQQSCIDVKSSNMLYLTSLSKVDGVYGFKTEQALQQIKKNFSREGHMYFETLMLSNMKTQYIRLAISNPDKYLEYLKGWDNRMNALAKT